MTRLKTRKRFFEPTTAIVLVIGLLIWAVYFFPVLQIIDWENIEKSVRSSHNEGLSLTTFGRWSLNSVDLIIADGFTGEFSVLYNYLSDLSINSLAWILDLSPAFLGGVVLGPFLGFCLLIVNYFFLMRVTNDWRITLFSCLIISIYSGPFISDRIWGPEAGWQWLLHVPFWTLPLATTQSYGWLLQLPSYCLIYLFFETNRKLYAISLGIILGLLLQIHTLTFINCATVLMIYFIYKTYSENLENRSRKLANTVLILNLLCILAVPLLSTGFGIFHFILVLSLTYLTNLLVGRRFQKHLYFLLAAGITSSPYLLTAVLHFNQLGSYDHVTSYAPLKAILLFFLPLWLLILGLVYNLIRRKDIFLQSQMKLVRWAFLILLSTVILAANRKYKCF